MSGTLLHICCAPCSIACIDTLRQEGIEPVGFWYNPNIHPMKEYKCARIRSLSTQKALISSWRLRTSTACASSSKLFYPNWDNRCATCYALRFGETALRRRAWLRPVHPPPCSSARTRITS
ncbi:MAG: epoxyqueuosine reductase QueH [Butyricicoccus sp.]